MTDPQPFKVLVVDDSPYCRQVLQRVIQSDPRFTVVATAANGHEAMAMTLRQSPDLITLDLEMPGMDGLAFLRWVAAHRPTPVVVVTHRGDEATVMKALELGAVDVVVKPTRLASPKLAELEHRLLAQLHGAAASSPWNLGKALALRGAGPVPDGIPVRPRAPVRLVALGASTGGPAAIQALLSRLPRDFPASMVVSQHMPPGFTRHFARRLDRNVGLRVREAATGDILEPGTVYICPGGRHLDLVQERDDRVRVALRREPRTLYTPSVDLMMKAAARTHGAATLGVLLTGMGRDGVEGLRAIRRAGGCTLAEAKESAVVFGMPRAAIQAGVVEHVLPLERMAGTILQLVSRKTIAS